jgi:exopolyphosphatase/guanosine-5'-triphosphate,3'-diphosphate pyrophosphatase
VKDADQTPLQEGDLLAAADLGSNSFHLVVARFQDGEPRVIDRLRDGVRLAAGVDEKGQLDEAHRHAAIQSLARFGQRIASLPSSRVRAVATNAVRQLAAPAAFLAEAEAALGHPIAVVSGREEARLIWLGAIHSLPPSSKQRLVVDIGGGSTEFIIGRGRQPLCTESVQVGCVVSSLRFFPNGELNARHWERAQEEIGLALQQFAGDYRRVGWSEAYGSSGTARAIGAVVEAMGFGNEGIDIASLGKLRDALLACGSIAKLSLPGLNKDRAPVIAGGVAVMQATFDVLGVELMRVSDFAMREGLLWDLVGRAQGEDTRQASVAALAKRHGVDSAHAARVERTAVKLFDQVATAWSLDAESREWLAWAARLHEIGLALAHSRHHKHAAYILRHADFAGFSQQEQSLLAAIVGNHRRKPDRDVLKALPERQRVSAARVTALLRLAVLLHRSRDAGAMPAIGLEADGRFLRLELPIRWAAAHPLSMADLKLEGEHQQRLGITLETTVD